MNAYRLVLCFISLTLAQIAGVARAAKFSVTDTTYGTFDALLQPRFDFAQEPPAQRSAGLLFSPYVRRVRLIFGGQIGSIVSFFAETDSPNLGQFSNWTPRLFMQDAFVEFNLYEALQIDAGIFFLPFSHQGTQGGQRLLGIDYGTLLMLEPSAQSSGGLIDSTLVWRDAGIMLRGRFAENLFEYRAAVTGGLSQFAGASDVNPHAIPRLTGRLAINLFEPEGDAGAPGLFYTGVNLQEDGDRLISPKKVLSVAGGASWQYNAVQVGAVNLVSYQAYSADLYFDIPVGDPTQALTGQVNFYSYDQGANSPATGRGIFGEAGYRIDRWEPLAAVEWFDVTNPKNVGNILYWRVGVNYWMYGHTANIKIDAGAKRITTASSDRALFLGRVQTQIFF